MGVDGEKRGAKGGNMGGQKFDELYKSLRLFAFLALCYLHLKSYLFATVVLLSSIPK